MKRCVRERRHRLPEECYRGRRAVSFTVNERCRIEGFVTSALVLELEATLLEAIAFYDADAFVYLFMPDHLHCILSGKSRKSDVLSAMKRFKQRSSIWLERHAPLIRWQKDFHDHTIRTNRDMEDHVRYILNNPVRAGLVDDWRSYPYKGSTVYDLNSWNGDCRTLHRARATNTARKCRP